MANTSTLKFTLISRSVNVTDEDMSQWTGKFNRVFDTRCALRVAGSPSYLAPFVDDLSLDTARAFRSDKEHSWAAGVSAETSFCRKLHAGIGKITRFEKYLHFMVNDTERKRFTCGQKPEKPTDGKSAQQTKVSTWYVKILYIGDARHNLLDPHLKHFDIPKPATRPTITPTLDV